VSIEVSANAFSNWPAFEKQLRHALAEQLDQDAVERVMQRTLRAFNAMQLRKLAGSLEEELAADVVHYETWNQDFHAAKMKVLLLLIDSFVSLELSRGENR
jgi:hypothetical protein